MNEQVGGALMGLHLSLHPLPIYTPYIKAQGAPLSIDGSLLFVIKKNFI